MKETFFNHTEVCALLYNGNILTAIQVFTQKTKLYNIPPSSRYAYLSSLNFGIYNYILYRENISLHNCCSENEEKILHLTNQSIIDIGTDIIKSYGYDNSYLIEKYKNVHVKNALTYIHSHLSEPLTLDSVSSHICINKAYLCHIFKKEVKISFCDYVLKQRIRLANKLLMTTDCSIQDIAITCGFKNAAYFSTCHKKYTGKKPSEMRKIS